MLDVPAFSHTVRSIKHQPKSHRYFFDVAIGSICLSMPHSLRATKKEQLRPAVCVR
jgi:hypothetical protein